MKLPSHSRIDSFIRTVATYYRTHKRSMPWRDDVSPYHIVVSEIMLQQTQVNRVSERFPLFIAQFPNWQALARASTTDVLRQWSGLGYNRRALYLKRIADEITSQGTKTGTLPRTIPELCTLPGIGPNTAGAICAYAFNDPHPFIETNIRSVYIHHFFPRIENTSLTPPHTQVHDSDLLPLITTTLKRALTTSYFKHDARQWYWALMDYGSFLKKSVPNPSRASIHHVRQTPFKGSNRELRSLILKLVLHTPASETDIVKHCSSYPPEQVCDAIHALVAEGFIRKKGVKYIV